MLDITRSGREIQARPGSMIAVDPIRHVVDDYHMSGGEMRRRVPSSIEAGNTRFAGRSGEIFADARTGNVDGLLRNARSA